MKSHPLDQAMRVSAQHFGVSVADMRSQRRSGAVHAARTWAMYLAYETAAGKIEEIAERFRRDHTIVRMVVRGRTRQVKEDAASARLFALLADRFDRV